MSRLAPVVPRRRHRRTVLAALLALTAAAACGGQSPTAPRAAHHARFDTAPKDTTHLVGSYENPGV